MNPFQCPLPRMNPVAQFDHIYPIYLLKHQIVYFTDVLKVFRLYPSLGSRVHVTVNHDVSRTENTKKVEINKENNKASIIIAEVAQDHYDVYKLYITLNSICESEDVKIEGEKRISYRITLKYINHIFLTAKLKT